MAPPRNKKNADDGTVLIAENRRARFDYAIDETIECGISLLGSEVKSLRARTVHFTNCYAVVKHGELWLQGLKIDRWKNAAAHLDLEPARERRLLVKKRDIERLDNLVSQKGASLVPLSMYFDGAWAKVQLGVGYGKSHGDKREDIKKRETNREMQRALRR